MLITKVVNICVSVCTTYTKIHKLNLNNLFSISFFVCVKDGAQLSHLSSSFVQYTSPNILIK